MRELEISVFDGQHPLDDLRYRAFALLQRRLEECLDLLIPLADARAPSEMLHVLPLRPNLLLVDQFLDD